MADDNTDPPVAGVTTDPSSNGTPAKPASVPVYTKEELTAKIAREVAKEREGRTSLEQRLAALEEEKRLAEEAKLTVTQRAENERKREREALTAERDAAKAQAAKEMSARHALRVEQAAARKVSSVAAQLSHPGLALDYEREIASHLVVQVDDRGAEYVAWQHAPGDVVPLEEGFKAFEETGALARFYRQATGSGAQHGSGAPGGRAAFAHLSPADKMLVGMSAKR